MQAGILPSGEAVCSLPNTLVALCLNNAGLERVRSTKALEGDTPPALGAGLDELLRHVSSLRKEGVDMMVSILRRLCEMGGQLIMSSSFSFLTIMCAHCLHPLLLGVNV